MASMTARAMTARTAAKPPVGQKTRIAIIPALATARTRHAMVIVAIGSWRSDTAPVNSPASSWATAMTVRNPLTHGTERSSPNTARTNHRLMIFAASDVARLDRKSLQRSRHTRCFLPPIMVIAVLHAEFFDANPATLPPYCTQCDSYKKPFHKWSTRYDERRWSIRHHDLEH